MTNGGGSFTNEYAFEEYYEQKSIRHEVFINFNYHRAARGILYWHLHKIIAS